MERVLKVWLKPLALLICLLTAAGSALATTVVTPLDDDLIIGARAIVRAKVLSIESGFDEQHTRIYTYITLKVQEVIKGEITERKIVIKELGGQVGDRIDVIYGNPRFTRGEKVLLYLDTWKDGSLRTYQMFLGKFSVLKDAKTGHQFAVRDSGDENVTVLPASKEAAGGTSTDRMELSSYLEMVRNRLAANLERSRKFEETYYGNIAKLSSPPEYKRGRGDIQPLFTLISPTNPGRWPEPDSNLPVPLTVNPDMAPNAQIVSDMSGAASAWSAVPGSALRVSYVGNLDQCYTGTGSPGINIVFNNCDGRNSPSPTCASILAWGGFSGTRFNPKVVNGTTFNFEITQGFVSFNPFASCHFGNACNLREIATHEIGHALGLGHSADSSATMAAIAHFDGRCASIRQDDANGIAFIYPGTGGGPGPISIVTATLPSGTIGSAYSQTMVATGGTTPYHWSIVSGSGNLPPGLTLSDSGVLSGNPTTAGTYNFTIRVTDTGSGSAQKAFSIVVGAAGTSFNSQFVSQTIPTTLTPGQVFVATLVWLNTGTQTWDGPSGGLRLISQNPFNNTTWGGNTVLLAPFTVGPGQQLNVSFQAVAPSAPGTYNFQWQLARDATNLFGQTSGNVSITVGSGGGGGGTNGAGFVTQSVPSSMTAGQTAAVSLTMSNTGTTTWSPGTYLLASLNPAGNSLWGLSQVALASSVAPGSNATFNFNITAPAAAGTYNFQWQMMQSGVGSFGSASTNVAVSVSGGGGGGGGSNNSQFMSQSVPSTWIPGQSYTVSISLKNTGTVTWFASTYKLSSQSPANNTSWGLSRASLTKNVPVGSMGVFTFTVRAPSTPGTYNFQWQMIQEGVGSFGALTPNVPLNNGGGGGTNGAGFVTQSVPSSMTAGQTAAVSLTMSNTGTTTWSPGTYLLASLNPAGNSLWGLSQVALASSVAPGSNATFNFNITAPAAAGTYNFQWQMMQSGVGSFGSASTNVAVSVSGGGGGGGGTNNASFASQSMPASMTAGQGGSASVTMTNNGTTTWAAGTYSLQSQNPQGNSTWGLARVNVASPVAPGSSATFTFPVTAPSTPGTYNFQWRMAQDGVGTFGDFSANVAVVVSSSSVLPLVITTTLIPHGNINSFYSAQITATGGVPAYRWSLSAGTLPSGVTLNANTGLISGTPTSGGTFNFTVMVRDQDGRSATRSYKILFR